MSVKKKKPIPDFSTYEEAARFFDSTDTTTLDLDAGEWTEFFASTKSSRRKGRSVHVPVEIEAAQFRRLAQLAKKKHTTPGALIQNAIAATLKR